MSAPLCWFSTPCSSVLVLDSALVLDCSPGLLATSARPALTVLVSVAE
ncbi:hypothetical protein [Streptomyces odontomachi]|nr:hypothetical protein [Streptomyces sp. ODS25]